MDINYAKGSSDEVRTASVGSLTFTVPWAYIEKTWHFDPSLRFYPRKAGNGFFLGLGLGLMNYSDNSLTIVTNTREFYTSTQTQVAFVPKLATGLNLKLSDVLFLDINGGLGVPLGKDIEVFLISASLRIGYRF